MAAYCIEFKVLQKGGVLTGNFLAISSLDKEFYRWINVE